MRTGAARAARTDVDLAGDLRDCATLATDASTNGPCDKRWRCGSETFSRIGRRISSP